MALLLTLAGFIATIARGFALHSRSTAACTEAQAVPGKTGICSCGAVVDRGTPMADPCGEVRAAGERTPAIGVLRAEEYLLGICAVPLLADKPCRAAGGDTLPICTLLVPLIAGAEGTVRGFCADPAIDLLARVGRARCSTGAVDACFPLGALPVKVVWRALCLQTGDPLAHPCACVVLVDADRSGHALLVGSAGGLYTVPTGSVACSVGALIGVCARFRTGVEFCAGKPCGALVRVESRTAQADSSHGRGVAVGGVSLLFAQLSMAVLRGYALPFGGFGDTVPRKAGVTTSAALLNGDDTGTLAVLFPPFHTRTAVRVESFRDATGSVYSGVASFAGVGVADSAVYGFTGVRVRIVHKTGFADALPVHIDHVASTAEGGFTEAPIGEGCLFTAGGEQKVLGLLAGAGVAVRCGVVVHTGPPLFGLTGVLKEGATDFATTVVGTGVIVTAWGEKKSNKNKEERLHSDPLARSWRGLKYW